ncbi:ABC transporter ATP-binding protein [Candidatus Saccharibacteria bacterium]|nr:ABC transporter ATP-binding protein [Candidatus Saccharibacteria bacterium]
MKSDTPRKTLRLYWHYSKRHKNLLRRFALLFITTQFASDILVPLLVSKILTNLAAGNFAELSFDKLTPVILMIIAAEIYQLILWRTVVRWVWQFEERVMRDLIMRVFGHLTNMSYNFFSNRFAGSLVSQTNKFVNSFERLSDALIWNVYPLIISFIFTVIILLPKAPLVVAGLVVFSFIFVPLVWWARRQQIPFNERWASDDTKRTGQLADSISNMMAVKSFGAEEHERQLMMERANNVYSRSIETMVIAMRLEYYTATVQRMINISVIITSVWLAVHHVASVGIVYLSLTYTSQILRRLWDLGNTFRNLTRVFGDAREMTQILEIEPEIEDNPNPEKARIKNGHISFNDVVFGYDNRGLVPLFENLSLDIKAGEKVGLVGHSGGGKTTITKLLLRFLDIQSGSISIDGQDISKIAQQDLRRHIAYVPQEPLLFHRSIADNIRYGRQAASDADVEKVAKMAHASEFIKDLPDGYETLVGERGVKLSGGQKQRIAIARAMIKNSPILILDEATSALDSESEKLIQDALWKLMEGRTAVVIAHRLSTIQRMDRIVVLEDGKIVEQGSHKELLEASGVYAKLWAHQSGGFLED